MGVRLSPGVPYINTTMNFDGYVKKIGTVDVNMLHQLANMANRLDWKHDSYYRYEKPLKEAKLIELPYIVRTTKNYTDEQLLFIENCSSLIEIVSAFFPGYIKVRGEVATLFPGVELGWHSDVHWFQKNCHRVHVPIITSLECLQLWVTYSEHLTIGNVYEINNRKIHSARNSGSTIRTHLILDFCHPNVWQSYIDDGGDILAILPAMIV
jgi:Aspartyl/Asparaginyl beta-hydroxylase